MICWQEQHDESELKRGEGGRIKVLEDPRVMVDEFAEVGMHRLKVQAVAGERVYKKYSAAVKEKEEVSDIRCSVC